MVEWHVNDGIAELIQELTADPPTNPHGDRVASYFLKDLVQGFFRFKAGEILENISVRNVGGYIREARLALLSSASVSAGTTSKKSKLVDSGDSSLLEFDVALVGTLPTDLDTGSETADTLYHVYVEWEKIDHTNRKVTFSLSPTAPALSGGRDVFRRVGVILNNSSSDILPFIQHGQGNDRWMMYDAEEADTQVISGGNATSFTDIDLKPFMPITSRRVHLFIRFDPVNPNNNVNFRPDGSTVTAPTLYTMKSGATSDDESFLIMPTGTNQIVEFEVVVMGDRLDVSLGGYMDEL